MTSQNGSFRDAVVRFGTEVEAALTRARRASADARALTGELRQATRDSTTVSQPRPGRDSVVAALDEDEDFSQRQILIGQDAPQSSSPIENAAGGHRNDPDREFSVADFLLGGADETRLPEHP